MHKNYFSHPQSSSEGVINLNFNGCVGSPQWPHVVIYFNFSLYWSLFWPKCKKEKKVPYWNWKKQKQITLHLISHWLTLKKLF